MLVAVWVLGWVILSGPEFADLGKHIAAAALFSNNFLLWSQSGYFDAPAAAKPLLHLWSLGVEEQFYLLVPFLLWLGSTGRRPSVSWMLRLSAVSLLLTVVYSVVPFYLLDTRFWELGAGVGIGYLSLCESPPREGKQSLEKVRYREFIVLAMLLMLSAALVCSAKLDPWNRLTILASSALIVLSVMAPISVLVAAAYREPKIWMDVSAGWQRHQRRYRNIAAIVGAVLIGVSLIAITSTDWPGPQTIWPVLGTTLVIMAGRSSWANKLLAWRPLVFIGGISYPLYLWHWPAIVFWKMFDFERSAIGQAIPVLGALPKH
jgi:peptidoglycan/LPS O-acetylase OafA/YrhL